MKNFNTINWESPRNEVKLEWKLGEGYYLQIKEQGTFTIHEYKIPKNLNNAICNEINNRCNRDRFPD